MQNPPKEWRREQPRTDNTKIKLQNKGIPHHFKLHFVGRASEEEEKPRSELFGSFQSIDPIPPRPKLNEPFRRRPIMSTPKRSLLWPLLLLLCRRGTSGGFTSCTGRTGERSHYLKRLDIH